MDHLPNYRICIIRLVKIMTTLLNKRYNLLFKKGSLPSTCGHEPGEFISPIFSVPKLNDNNTCTPYPKFKEV